MAGLYRGRHIGARAVRIQKAILALYGGASGEMTRLGRCNILTLPKSEQVRSPVMNGLAT
jgi:hypothetical protein